MTTEKDTAVTEKEGDMVEEARWTLVAMPKAAQKRIKELTKDSENQSQNMYGMKTAQQDRDKWKDARCENSHASQSLGLSTPLGCKDARDHDVTISTRATAQQRIPPASDREGDTADKTSNKKTYEENFQMPAVLVRHGASDLGKKVKAATTLRLAATHARVAYIHRCRPANVTESEGANVDALLRRLSPVDNDAAAAQLNRVALRAADLVQQPRGTQSRSPSQHSTT
ncbi:hypothetical protein GSI_02853 [Ganoderma sinense ZZ0214-1]|uniref:Uncharacterized protein n=1 Tax=Ganoderma sinense ZZ0214-1 TaxID=1077348 RepID=A0A2G8SMS1_9APHY|nr:hypothetical protein GSI_02853 [Ganoderma sinense ZZ0214-1]